VELQQEQVTTQGDAPSMEQHQQLIQQRQSSSTSFSFWAVLWLGPVRFGPRGAFPRLVALEEALVEEALDMGLDSLDSLITFLLQQKHHMIRWIEVLLAREPQIMEVPRKLCNWPVVNNRSIMQDNNIIKHVENFRRRLVHSAQNWYTRGCQLLESLHQGESCIGVQPTKWLVKKK